MPENLEADGTVAKLTPKTNNAGELTGFTQVEVSLPGKQYPLRLDLDNAKDAVLIDACRSALTWPVAHIWYKEVESKGINPKSGKPYINRYLTRVEPGTAAAQSAPTNGKPAAGRSDYYRPRDPHETRSIVRQVAIKSAMEFTANTAADITTDEIRNTLISDAFALAEQIEGWVFRPDPTEPDQPPAEPTEPATTGPTDPLERARWFYDRADTFDKLLAAVKQVGENHERFATVAEWEAALDAAMPYAGTEADRKALGTTIFHYKSHINTTTKQAEDVF